MVLQNNDELAPDPLRDLVVWFANSIECLRIAAVQQEDELTGLCRVIISLNFHSVNIKAFELPPVKIEVALSTNMRVPKPTFSVILAISV